MTDQNIEIVKFSVGFKVGGDKCTDRSVIIKKISVQFKNKMVNQTDKIHQNRYLYVNKGVGRIFRADNIGSFFILSVDTNKQ